MLLSRSSRAGFVFLVVFSLIPAARVSAEPVQVSPTVDANTTALYRFKEGSGTTTACEVSGVPVGTFYNAAWVPGREYYAVATGPGYVRMADNAALRPRNAITVEVWAKLVQSSGDLVCKNTVYLLRLGTTITAMFYIDGSWRSFDGHLSVPVNQWTHIAITYNASTRTAAIYINGVLDTAKTYTSTELPTGLINQGTASLYVGKNDWSQPSGNYATAKVDALRISNVARAFDPLYPTPPPPPTPDGNLVPNGDFEAGLTGWRLNGEGDVNLIWETLSSGAPSGKKYIHSLASARTDFNSLRVSASPSDLLSRPFTVYPGRQYNLSLRLKASSNRSVSVSLYAAGGGSLSTVSGSSQSLSVTTAWQQFNWAVTIPTSFSSPSVCVNIPYPSSGELYVDDVRLVGGSSLLNPILKDRLILAPDSLPIGNVYHAGVPASTAWNLVNNDAAAHDVTIEATAVDWEGKSLPATALGTFHVPAGGAVAVPFSIDTNRRGTFLLGFNLASEGQTWSQLAQFKYAVVAPMKNVGNAENSQFGMNTHMEREPTPHLARSMEVLSQCGVKWIRAWWGWGMCENPQGTYNYAEYDRQYDVVTNGTGMRIMPILLRYYWNYEWDWAGPVTAPTAENNYTRGIQQYPYDYMLPAWSTWVGKVVQRFNGRISAYELWNEPTMGAGEGGVQTPAQYAALLNATTPYLRAADPNAKLVAFAGVPNSFMQQTLALGTASLMDAVSEHTYSQTMQPEVGYPTELSNVRTIMQNGGAGGKPIWCTEQGIGGDDDGYSVPSNSEADVAALYTRNFVTSAANGSSKFFWFSAQCSPTYGWAVYYENYIPRPRLTALNACAAFLEGATYRKSFYPSNSATYAHLFQGSSAVCVLWNIDTAVSLSLPIDAAKLQAFDTMGNPIAVTGSSTQASVAIPVRRPVFLRCAAADYSLLDAALAGMRAASVYPVSVSARSVAGNVLVTLTGTSTAPVDGIVELIPAATAVPPDWPPLQHFHSLQMGRTTTLTFVVPKKKSVKAVRVGVGDRQVQSLTVPFTGP